MRRNMRALERDNYRHCAGQLRGAKNGRYLSRGTMDKAPLISLKIQ